MCSRIIQADRLTAAQASLGGCLRFLGMWLEIWCNVSNGATSSTTSNAQLMRNVMHHGRSTMGAKTWKVGKLTLGACWSVVGGGWRVGVGCRCAVLYRRRNEGRLEKKGKRKKRRAVRRRSRPRGACLPTDGRTDGPLFSVYETKQEQDKTEQEAEDETRRGETRRNVLVGLFASSIHGCVLVCLCACFVSPCRLHIQYTLGFVSSHLISSCLGILHPSKADHVSPCVVWVSSSLARCSNGQASQPSPFSKASSGLCLYLRSGFCLCLRNGGTDARTKKGVHLWEASRLSFLSIVASSVYPPDKQSK